MVTTKEKLVVDTHDYDKGVKAYRHKKSSSHKGRQQKRKQGMKDL